MRSTNESKNKFERKPEPSKSFCRIKKIKKE